MSGPTFRFLRWAPTAVAVICSLSASAFASIWSASAPSSSSCRTLCLVSGQHLLLAEFRAGLYAWGGMELKWLRRFLAPAICCLAMYAFSKDKKALIQMPLMMASLCMGYEAVSQVGRVLRRGLFGLVMI